MPNKKGGSKAEVQSGLMLSEYDYMKKNLEEYLNLIEKIPAEVWDRWNLLYSIECKELQEKSVNWQLVRLFADLDKHYGEVCSYKIITTHQRQLMLYLLLKDMKLENGRRKKLAGLLKNVGSKSKNSFGAACISLAAALDLLPSAENKDYHAYAQGIIELRTTLYVSYNVEVFQESRSQILSPSLAHTEEWYEMLRNAKHVPTIEDFQLITDINIPIDVWISARNYSFKSRDKLKHRNVDLLIDEFNKGILSTINNVEDMNLIACRLRIQQFLERGDFNGFILACMQLDGHFKNFKYSESEIKKVVKKIEAGLKEFPYASDFFHRLNSINTIEEDKQIMLRVSVELNRVKEAKKDFDEAIYQFRSYALTIKEPNRSVVLGLAWDLEEACNVYLLSNVFSSQSEKENLYDAKYKNYKTFFDKARDLFNDACSKMKTTQSELNLISKFFQGILRFFSAIRMRNYPESQYINWKLFGANRHIGQQTVKLQEKLIKLKPKK